MSVTSPLQVTLSGLIGVREEHVKRQGRCWVRGFSPLATVEKRRQSNLYRLLKPTGFTLGGVRENSTEIRFGCVKLNGFILYIDEINPIVIIVFFFYVSIIIDN